MATSIIKEPTQLVINEYRAGAAKNISGNTTTSEDIDISKAGYTPIAVLGVSTNHGSVMIQGFSIVNGAFRIYGRNIGSSAVSNVTFGVWVTYKKD